MANTFKASTFAAWSYRPATLAGNTITGPGRNYELDFYLCQPFDLDAPE